jgi:hypothetical protein
VKTTQTSSPFTVESLAALSDELLKIAADQQAKKPSTFKKVLKNSLLVAGGYGVGHGVGMLADKGLGKALGDKWSKMVPESKKKWAYPALGAASAGAFLANEYLNYKRQQALQDE